MTFPMPRFLRGFRAIMYKEFIIMFRDRTTLFFMFFPPLLPLPDAYVKLVPDSPRRGQMASYADCKTDAGGTCSMLGVAPGSYHAFAFAEERQVDFRDAAATAEIEDSGKAVSIGEGEQQGVELTPVLEDR